MTARLFTLDPVEGFRPKTFAGHRDAVLGAYFAADGKTVSLSLLEAWNDFSLQRRYTQSVVTAPSLHGKQNPTRRYLMPKATRTMSL